MRYLVQYDDADGQLALFSELFATFDDATEAARDALSIGSWKVARVCIYDDDQRGKCVYDSAAG